VLGVVAGAALGPAILNALNLTDGVRPVAAVLVLVICGSLGSTFGYWAGEPMRNAVLRRGFARPPEMLAGSLFSVFAVLSVAWFLGLTFSQGPSAELGTMIQNSAVLRSLDAVFPRPPGFLSGVRGTLANVPFPSVFAGLPPLQPEPLQPPASVDTPSVQEATRAVYRVESRGCGGVVTGSAYPVAPGYLVTNAHVVSGTSDTLLSQDVLHLRDIRATVVLFDPDIDVAILWAPQVSVAGLTPSPGARGTVGAVIGYPGGGAETISPAVIEEPISATGRDIYNDGLVKREIYIMATQVRPGNSGGPVVDIQGHVLGLVFAASSTNPDQGYALTSDEIQGDVSRGIGRTGGVNTAAYHCAV
jgi:S1-C subfamily serine protease